MQLKKLPASKNLEFGFFGASTGAASAIKAATLLPNLIKAVVSRGGRPDLVPGDLSHLKAPTLLIVGELDNEVLSLNEQAYRNIPALKSLKIVEGATHLFEEPGALEEVARLSGDWFVRHMALENASGQIAQHV
jgi:pimeloyl-ACP methyl ester carboxylesterase